MPIQVLTFRDHTSSYKDMQERINEFLAHVRKEDVIDIKYTADSEHVHAMVIFNEESRL